MSELDEEVVVESSVGSSCLRVISVRVVVVLLSRGRLVQMDTHLGGLENVSEPKELGSYSLNLNLN